MYQRRRWFSQGDYSMLPVYLLAVAWNRESIAKSFCIRIPWSLRVVMVDGLLLFSCCCCCCCLSRALAFGATTTFDPCCWDWDAWPRLHEILVPNFIWYSRLFTTLIIWNRAITAAKLYQKNTGRVQRCVYEMRERWSNSSPHKHKREAKRTR